MTTDEYSYLEDGTTQRALTWVRRQNQRTSSEIESDPRFEQFRKFALGSEATVDQPGAAGRVIPGSFAIDHGWVYQIVRDTRNPRGLLRRIKWNAFLRHELTWIDLVDIDALAKEESSNWILLYAYFSPAGGRCLLQFSKSGSDETAWREFDVDKRRFVEEGFNVSRGSSTHIAWSTDDSVLLSTDCGPGSINAAGLPLLVKRWHRGESIEKATEVFRGRPDDFFVGVQEEDFGSPDSPADGRSRTVLIVEWTRDHIQTWWQADSAGHLERLNLPSKLAARPSRFGDEYLIMPTEDWVLRERKWPANSLLAVRIKSIVDASPEVRQVMAPSEGVALRWWMKTESGLVVCGSSANSELLWRVRDMGKSWHATSMNFPALGSVSPIMSSETAGVAFVKYTGVLHPTTIYKVDVARLTLESFEANPSEFDSDKFLAESLRATSSDGTQVPYVLVRSKTLSFDGRSPVLLEGYGAAGAPAPTSEYSGTLGKLWLERGGSYAVADVRGGMGHVPGWWVKGAQRYHTYDDMEAVALDLINRKITSTGRLAIKGHSAGGLLAAVVMTRKPALFGAAILEAALLDQFRMDLVIGQRAMDADFGSPEIPEEKLFLERTSPFQNLRAGMSLPKPLIITSTTDQTVFPAQARRFAAKLEDLGIPFLFRETSEGGHSMASTPGERADLDALIYTYLSQRLLDSPRIAEPRSRIG